ncbi:hypothetical protein Leryth_024569 [Lithospermum erythrorhizon]|nr:hypothetical protein Leryth_024569 [Lithospermum erythrorhizon]
MKSPFHDIPKILKELRTNPTHSLLSLIPKSISQLSLGFRFLPGKEDFVFKNLKLPVSLDGLSMLRDKLGLTFSRESLYSRGVGCTVWYGFHDGDVMSGLLSLFSPIENYEQFFYNPSSYVYPGFEKITLVENHNNLSTLANAFADQKPFTEIQIPSCNNISPHIIAGGITLGLVVVLLSVGEIPTESKTTTTNLGYTTSNNVVEIESPMMNEIMDLGINDNREWAFETLANRVYWALELLF